MSEKIKAIPYSEKLCFKCLKESDNITTYTMCARGYGSSYDGFESKLQLCEHCNKPEIKEWFDECPKMGEGDWCGEYEFEGNINKLINSLPLQGQELFENSLAGGYGCHCTMDAQDWIDYNLGILPHEKCKEYSLYSKEEKEAYRDRYPNCKHVKIKVYSDGSKGSSCRMGAYGNGDGKCGVNMADECYMCSIYEEREGDIEVVDEKSGYYKREKHRLNDMIAYAHKRLQMIEDENLEYEY